MTYESGQATFEQAGLPFPPMPEALRDDLQQIAPFAYSTQPDDAFPLIVAVIQALRDDSLSEHVSIAYIERGVNSHTLRYQLVTRNLLLFVEWMIGGGYADREANIEQVRHDLQTITHLLDNPLDDEAVLVRDDVSQQGWMRYDLKTKTEHPWQKTTNPLQSAADYLKR